MNGFALFIAIGGGLLAGFGASFYIFAGLLDKSNNIGDTLCDFDHYTSQDIHYTRNADDVPSTDRYRFLRDFGGDPADRERDVKSSEARLAREESGMYDNLPPVDVPIFAPPGREGR